ncbi:MAG: hypothetical protein ABI556_09920, partial [Gemmatimonadales bacterium]
SSLLTQQRKYREGELAALRGLQWEKNPFLYGFLAGARYRAGRLDEARRTIAYGLREFPNSVLLLALRIEMTEAMGDFGRADSLAHSAPRGNNEFPRQQQAFIDAILGKIDEARQHLVDVRRAQEATGGLSAVLTSLLLAQLELDLARDTSRALRIADSVPSSAAWRNLHARERPYVSLAHFYVLSGKADRARELLSTFEREVPVDFRARVLRLSSRTHAMVRVAAGDRAAISEIKASVADDPQPISVLADLVWAYQRVGAHESAAREARAYLDEVSPRRMEQDAFYLSSMRKLAKTAATSAVRK